MALRKMTLPSREVPKVEYGLRLLGAHVCSALVWLAAVLAQGLLMEGLPCGLQLGVGLQSALLFRLSLLQAGPRCRMPVSAPD